MSQPSLAGFADRSAAGRASAGSLPTHIPPASPKGGFLTARQYGVEGGFRTPRQYESELVQIMRRRMDTYEQKVSAQMQEAVQAFQMRLDRFEAKMTTTEACQTRFRVDMSEVKGSCTGLSEELQTQTRLKEELHQRYQGLAHELKEVNKRVQEDKEAREQERLAALRDNCKGLSDDVQMHRLKGEFNQRCQSMEHELREVNTRVQEEKEAREKDHGAVLVRLADITTRLQGEHEPVTARILDIDFQLCQEKAKRDHEQEVAAAHLAAINSRLLIETTIREDEQAVTDRRLEALCTREEVGRLFSDEYVLWEVRASAGVSVHREKCIDSELCNRKPYQAEVCGRLEGAWIRLLSEPGFIENIPAAVQKKRDGIARQLDRMRLELEEVWKDTDFEQKVPKFFSIYEQTEAPQTFRELLMKLQTFLSEWARGSENGSAWVRENVTNRSSENRISEVDVDVFYRALQTKMEARLTPGLTEREKVGVAAAALWTTEEKLAVAEKRFCFILADTIRSDNEHLLKSGGAAVQRAINSYVVNRGAIPSEVSAEWDGKSYRGTGIPEDKVDFWRRLMQKPCGKRRYRTRMPLATTRAKSKSFEFLGIAQFCKVLFTFNFRDDRGRVGDLWCCFDTPPSARSLEGITCASGEYETHLVPYTVLEVTKFDDSKAGEEYDSTTGSGVTFIEVRVVRENKDAPQRMRMIEWH